MAVHNNTNCRMKKKGKGLSFDQKIKKMLSIFHKTKDVFNYQEIEKLSIKAGIPFPSVKDILNALKADSLIECQKIGAGVFYWSFPSRAYQTMSSRLEITQKQIQAYEQQISILESEISAAKQGRQETVKQQVDQAQREEYERELQRVQQEHGQLQKQVQKYIRFDPERYQLLGNDQHDAVKQNNELKLLINEQVDNLEQIKKYIKSNQAGIRDSEIEECYGIPADLEYYDL